ncbi:MAG: DNA-binding response regulator [Frankiales bacterium]|nr:DNA-binding response regulator [Frankiales bacterium]
MSHVLVVDDEPQLLRALVLSLTHRGFQVSTAADGANALAIAEAGRPDLLLLDLGLPDMDGLEAIRRLRMTHPELPIIVLSARSGNSDKIVALDLGALDYVTKPFDMNELLARVRAVLRRSSPSPALPVIELDGISVDLAARLITRAEGEVGPPIHLTPTEWRMLEVLLTRPGVLVSARELLTHLRGEPDNTEGSYLRIYMAQLRRKLEREPSRPRHLITESGMGYRFQP